MLNRNAINFKKLITNVNLSRFSSFSDVPVYETADHIPSSEKREKMNMFMAINNSLDIILKKDDS